jgi:hypothetical protein
MRGTPFCALIVTYYYLLNYTTKYTIINKLSPPRLQQYCDSKLCFLTSGSGEPTETLTARAKIGEKIMRKINLPDGSCAE